MRCSHSSSCQPTSPGTPSARSAARLTSDSATACSAGIPNTAHSSTRPPSCAPSALGMAKAAPRIACRRLSMTNASARLIGLPMKANTIRTSATPKSQPAICTAMLATRLDRTALRQIKAGEQEAPKAEPERGRPRQRRVGSERGKRKQADHREEKLGCRLDEDIDNDARHPERGRNPVKRQQPRANDIAADLRHRQKHIDRLSNEPQGSTCSKLRPGVRWKKQPPAHPCHRNRD